VSQESSCSLLQKYVVHGGTAVSGRCTYIRVLSVRAISFKAARCGTGYFGIEALSGRPVMPLDVDPMYRDKMNEGKYLHVPVTPCSDISARGI
jgi:hypothetical protein